MQKLQIQLHYSEMTAPTRAHASDVGLDLTALRVEAKTERRFVFDTGVSVQPPEGFYVEVVPRSSIAKTDFIMANSVGIIDPDYRGKILVALRYLGEGDGARAAQELVGTRIAQLLLRRLEPCEVEVVQGLEETARGAGGFGSSGR
jgi:dUTP pyrophosphatase